MSKNLKDSPEDKTLKEHYEHIAKEPNPFWEPEIRPFWDESTTKLSDAQLSDEVLLEYKKAMVLYGPPGTSKSYQARRMAEHIIAKALREQMAGKIEYCFKLLPQALSTHIHKLQLHPNYTYDDFIVGKTIRANKVVVEKGFMLKLIDSIRTDDTLPHVIILDEINRVDISRVFGELFTAMETSYRQKGEGVKLSVKDSRGNDIYLKVPENMYFIGTMNMIDFSLEQVDFALRRRFLWRLSTYDKDRLENILSEKVKEASLDGMPDDYGKTCTDLNYQIECEPNLGRDYLIGHAFFAEIVDIYKTVGDWRNAKNILWQISLLPTLEAYCGSMDSSTKEKFIENCKNAFMPKDKQGKDQTNPT